MSDEHTPPGPGITNVCMLIQRLRPMFSGQGAQVEELCRECATRGINITILTAGQGPHRRWENVDGYRVRRLRADLPGIGRWLRRGRFRSEIFGLKTFLWLLIHGWKLDLIHAHAQSDALFTAWLFSRIRGIPLIFEMTLVGEDDVESFAHRQARLAALRFGIFRRCDGFVAISPALARGYLDAGMPAAKLRLIPQAVDTRRFRRADDKPKLRRRLGIAATAPVVTFVGSLVRRKGIDLLLAAWSRIHRRYPDAQLVLVGVHEFPDDAAATDFLRRGLEGLSGAARAAVSQTGVVDNVEDFLAAADIFAFPSRREGFGTVMAEAMSCETPCVVSEIPGITDFIFTRDGACGTVVGADDATALANAVLELLGDPARAADMGHAARQRVRENFALEPIADRYLEFYGELAGHGLDA